MDTYTADLAIQAILGRGTDFVGGIDNEALDFSQLEDFINNDGSQGTNYFGDSLNTATPTAGGKLLNVIVENKRNNNGHSLPESPPDSSSEHPYSPQDGCEAPQQQQQQTLTPSSADAAMYTNLTTPPNHLYKTSPTGAGSILSPILTDSLILGSHHIVVADQSSEQQHQLIDTGGNILQDGRLLMSAAGAGGAAILNSRIIQDGMHQGDSSILQDRIILSENSVGDNNRPLLISSDSGGSFDRGIYKNEEYDKNIVHLGYSPNMDSLQRATNNIDTNNLCEQNLESIQGVYTNLQTVPKKRKLSQDSPLVKSEPEHCTTSQLSPSEHLNTSIDEEYASSEACLSESQYQCIRFSAFQQNNWHALCDQNLTEMPVPHYRVDADKGFNFSNADDAFVCQKKNHFQITCHVQLLGDAQFVKTPDGFQKISSFHLHFYGVKHDCPTQTIRVEQSQSDRSKKPFHPVLVELVSTQVTKVTVGRLHFSETTSNNMRKKGKPNPEQRYFQLVVGLHAHTTNGHFPVVSHASQKIIVRASNPGQFESDVELCWQKGQTQDSVVHSGRVGINTDRPDESLVVHGNIKITGHIIQPSDIRAKKNIVECNTAEQLQNVQKLRVVRYEYEPALASQLSRDHTCTDTGVIAQEVAQVLPEAVRPAGDLLLENGSSIDNFLVVNKERIFMENIGAVKELCKVTDNLETRIDQLERINRRLNRLKRGDSLKSNSTVASSKLSFSHKCSNTHNHHSCHKEDEFCSNKFIQVVIVVLVLIMAFCLAAITTLYLVEAARRSQHIQSNFDEIRRDLSPKRLSKSNKVRTWSSTSPPYHPTNHYKEDEITEITVDPGFLERPSTVIGKPKECSNCQVYCCGNPSQRPQDLITSHFSEKKPPNVNRNKTGPLINMEKNKIELPFHSNNIFKQIRQKRDTDEANLLNISDDQLFIITINGRNFSEILTPEYRSQSSSYNLSYSVPISKYMPDEFINLTFRSTQSNTKEIEHCYNDYKLYECPFISSSAMFYDDKMRIRQKINEDNPNPGFQSVIFEVDMLDFQVKTMTYRASLRQNQNTCKLSPTKLGLEYVEYNFHFYRHCDE